MKTGEKLDKAPEWFCNLTDMPDFGGAHREITELMLRTPELFNARERAFLNHCARNDGLTEKQFNWLARLHARSSFYWASVSKAASGRLSDEV